MVRPTELAERLRRGDAPTLLDVREPIEFQIARIEGAELVPLSKLPEWAERRGHDAEIVVICHHGVRSQFACDYLRGAGFARVFNLVGGIDRWSTEVDETVARY